MEIVILIFKIAFLAYLTWILVKLFWHLFCSIKAKDKKSILINSLLFTLGSILYFVLFDPIGRISFIYQEITKLF